MKTLYINCILIFILFPAYGQQGEIFQIGDNDFVAGDLYNQVESYKAKQNGENWCWATCVQMVLKKQGLYVEQCDIVKHGFGQQFCKDLPADCFIIKEAANGWIVDGKMIKAKVEENLSDITPHVLIDDLAFKYPLIIGLNIDNQPVGHAYVLTAIYFSYDAYNRKIPYKVVLRDPWPGKPSRVELSWDNFFQRINCVTHVTF